MSTEEPTTTSPGAARPVQRRSHRGLDNVVGSRWWVGPEAVAHAEAGVAGVAGRGAGAALGRADHGDFYALAGGRGDGAGGAGPGPGAGVAGRRYATLPPGCRSTTTPGRSIRPQRRLARDRDRSSRLAATVGAGWANGFWSAIGHIGSRDTSPPVAAGHHRDGGSG